MSETSAPKLRVATYNVHGCVGMDRQRSEARIAEVIAQLSVDIVALQELDLSRTRSAGVDQTGMIAEQLGWHSYFHPAMRRGEEHYGNAILSRYPLTFRRTAELPGTAPFFCRENRAAIGMDVEQISVLCTLSTRISVSAGASACCKQNCSPASSGMQPSPIILRLSYSATLTVCRVHDPIARWSRICTMYARLFERSSPSVLSPRGFPLWPLIIFL